MESTMVTELNTIHYTFNWNISPFDIICPVDRSEFDKLTSECFTVKGTDGLETEWYVTTGGTFKANEDAVFYIYLNLKGAKNGDGTNHSECLRCKFTAGIGSDEEDGIVKGSTVHNFSESASNWGWREFLTIEELRGTIQNNTLHVRVELRIYGKYSTSVTLLPLLRSEGVNTFEVLSVDLGKMFNNEENSDVKIICGNETLYAHKLILSARSSVLSTMLKSDMQEMATSQIVLTDIDATTFKAILLYIYTGKVEINDTTSHNDLIYAAEKYDLSDLKQHCFEQMYKSATVGTIGNLAVAAELYNADEKIKQPIKEFCQRNIAELIKDPAIKSQMISNPRAFL